MQFLLIFNAALALAEKLLPVITEAFARGEMTVAEQKEARDRYLALRAAGDAAFAGPAWKRSKPKA